MATNGNEKVQASNLSEEMKLQALQTIAQRSMMAQDRQAAAVTEDVFTLARLGSSLAKIGADDERMVKEFSQHLLERARQRLAYIEEIVGKLK